ncbi:MAG: hypothetical protein IFNCLDLE_02630 [Ignavibacteriaceae bacterium]|nr:hypothetical protein [Ignavibacteriaceae bacterium]
MLNVGDRVKVVASKELKPWLDKKGRECLGKVCTITSMGQSPDDKRKIVYCLNDNQYEINFPASSLKKTKAPLTKEVKEVKNDKKEDAAGGFMQFLKEIADVVEEKEEDMSDLKDKTKELLLDAVAGQSLCLSKKVQRLEKSDRYMGFAIWVIVAYLVFDVVIKLFVR